MTNIADKDKLVSIVVIAYNEEMKISDALTSIINQESRFEIEIIFVDDGSIDKTHVIASKLLSAYEHKKIVRFESNRGRGNARHAGQAIASGKYVGFVDSDITLPPNWVEELVNQMENKDLDAVSGIAIPDGDCVVISRIANLEPKVRGGSALLTGNNLIIKKSVIDETPFRKIPYGDDIRLAWDLERKGFKLASILGVIVAHSESKSFRKTIKWQFEQGCDATKLLFEYHKFRLPDMAWFATFPVILAPSLLGYKNVGGFAFLAFLLIAYTQLLSLIFLNSRFFLRFSKRRTIYGVFVNSLFMSSYILGRYVGIFKPTNKQKEL
jgi:glycosyltransferase involved in cell wall biosynthesis